MKKSVVLGSSLAVVLAALAIERGRALAAGPFDFKPNWLTILPVVAMWVALVAIVLRKGLKAAESARKAKTAPAAAYAETSSADFALAAPGLVRFLNDRSGTSFMETAILIPTLLMLCCGTMDFARVVYAGVEIASAARAGVQFGALTPGNTGNTAGMVQAALTDAADLGSTVTASASNFCSCSGSTVSCSSSCTGGVTPDGYVSVTANYTFNTVLPYPGLPQTVSLSRTAKMRAQ